MVNAGDISRLESESLITEQEMCHQGTHRFEHDTDSSNYHINDASPPCLQPVRHQCHTYRSVDDRSLDQLATMYQDCGYHTLLKGTAAYYLPV